MKQVLTPIILTLGLFGTLIWGHVVYSHPFLYFLLGLMAVIGCTSMLMRPIFSFSILMSLILIVGFANISLGWNQHLDLKGQGMSIEIQVILTVGAILAWIAGYSVYQNNAELRELQAEVEQLRKVEEETGILTFSEFLSRAQLLVTGLIRRDEQGFLVKIQLNTEDALYKQKVLFEKLSMIVLESLRTEYDLACELSENSLLVFLNNTDEAGMQIVQDRIQSNITKDLKIAPSSLYIQKHRIQEGWEETFSFINTWRKVG